MVGKGVRRHRAFEVVANDQLYFIDVHADDARLRVELRDDDLERWDADLDAAFIEALTARTGVHRRHEAFVALLLDALQSVSIPVLFLFGAHEGKQE